jgi:hypothetical protein
MNKEELTKQIEVLESELDKLKEQVNKPEPVKGWSPKERGTKTRMMIEDYTGYLKHGVIFQSPKEALKHSKFQKLQNWLYQLALELNEGWKPDWSDSSQGKYSIYYDNRYEKYDAELLFVSNTLGGAYFKDVETVSKAIEIIKTWELNNAE